MLGLVDRMLVVGHHTPVLTNLILRSCSVDAVEPADTCPVTTAILLKATDIVERTRRRNAVNDVA